MVNVRIRSAIANLTLVFAAVLISLLVLEVGVRVSQYQRFAVNIFALENRGPLVIDEKLGWRAMPNFVREGTWQDAAGTNYPVSMSTDAKGFRRYGDVNTRKTKMLIVGDSYTHAIETSDGETYFDVLGASVPVELFVYGAGGFGTLQEYLIIDQYLSEIRPDLILLQFCGNDFSNNSAEYEAIDLGNNNGLVRPYLQPDGTIRHTLARRYQALWSFANSYSRLLAAVLFRLDNAFQEPPSRKERARVRAAAIDTTDRILAMLKNRAGEVPIYGFSTGSSAAVYDNFAALSENNGIVFIAGVPQALDEAESAGLVGRVADGAHWSPAGHAVIGASLAEFFTAELESD